MAVLTMETLQISDFPVSIDNLKISHDGTKVAFSAQGVFCQQWFLLTCRSIPWLVHGGNCC